MSSQGAALSVYQDVHLQLHKFYIFGYITPRLFILQLAYALAMHT